MRHRSPLVVAALAACLMSATAHSAEPPLFSEHLLPGASMRQANRYISGLAEARSTRQLQVVHARTSQINIATERLYLNLVPGKPLVVDQLNAYRNDDGTVVWNGLVGGTAVAAARMQRHGSNESVEDPLNTATFVRNGDMLTGSVRVQGRLYQIEPVGHGRHAVIEVDEAALPPKDGGQPIPMGEELSFAPSVSEPPGLPTVIRVMFVYSKHAGENTVDPIGWAQQLIAEANAGYEASQVNLRLQLASAKVSNYQEFSASDRGTKGWASIKKDVGRFQEKNDGHLDSYHALRNEVGADIMMLVRRRNVDACGYASAILASARTAFAAIGRDCGPGTYTFTHEVGHLQGARHNPEEDRKRKPFAYGHGFFSCEGGFTTVMGYLPDGCPTSQAGWFSNPNLFVNGVRVGTARTHDNARVLNETRERMAGFR